MSIGGVVVIYGSEEVESLGSVLPEALKDTIGKL